MQGMAAGRLPRGWHLSAALEAWALDMTSGHDTHGKACSVQEALTVHESPPPWLLQCMQVKLFLAQHLASLSDGLPWQEAGGES